MNRKIEEGIKRFGLDPIPCRLMFEYRTQHNRFRRNLKVAMNQMYSADLVDIVPDEQARKRGKVVVIDKPLFAVLAETVISSPSREVSHNPV